MADEQPEHDQAAEGASIGELEQGMRLMKVKDSGKGDKPKQTKAQKKRAWVEARNTRVVEHFTTHYGADKLECWQAVSRKIGVEVGKTSNACKTILKRVFFNIHDFVEADRQGLLPRRFGSAKELSAYIKRTKKYFPLDQAKENPVLRWMLINVR